ncbi:hypothetical protein DS659_20750 [Salmonella enterica subsp. enterica serovar Kentucky]|nr:hypothetical protein [Salmonella enterica subsp. enterica serovar Kentucky]EBX8913125.1 hypothetical protein [Salmonella enterica subsp. enterica serovar Agoueve]ECD4974454.1 hypothetical protein [Salmonella enterica subsp. enterica serovar Oranienburg]
MMNESDKKRFNMRIPGEVLVSAEVYSGPISSAADVCITEPVLYRRICNYVLLNGTDLQELFLTDRYLYMSCFIRDVVGFKTEFENEELLKPLFSHDKGGTVAFLISFPEKAC